MKHSFTVRGPTLGSNHKKSAYRTSGTGGRNESIEHGAIGGELANLNNN